MSSFIVPENKRFTNPQLINQMNPDALEGLRTAVNNNQSAIALRYLVNILDILDEERKPKAAPKTAPVKGKAATADKVDE